MNNNTLNIAVIGLGPKFKGGIANFTLSLCQSLVRFANARVHLFSWSQQYPAIIPREFLDKKSKIIQPKEFDLTYCLNYNNPASWIHTANEIVKTKPDIVIVQWSIALQGLPLKFVINRLKRKLPACIVIFDIHNVVQKESSSLDQSLTKSTLTLGDKYIVHGKLTEREFKNVFPDLAIKISDEQFDLSNKEREMLRLFHPNYDMFDGHVPFDAAAFKKHHNIKGFVFLFFGFIRKYKGCHYAIQAFAEFIKTHPDATLVIAGESFWEKATSKGLLQKLQNKTFKMMKRIFIKNSQNDEWDYKPLELIHQLGIEKNVVLFNQFIANEEVHQYFDIADAVVNFYEYATPSGIESIAYQFGVQILATPVGHFDDAIVDGVNGYKAKSFETKDLADAMTQAYEKPISRNEIKQYGKKFSWKNYVKAIVGNDEE